MFKSRYNLIVSWSSRRNPKDGSNNIETFLLRASILETPCSILLIIPIRTRRRMQPSSSNLMI